jgi:hypothetical protein
MLPPDWCAPVICPGVDLAKPGIYRWVIDGAGVYIGKYTTASRPTQEYRRNVIRILTEQPSHHPNGKFRRVHEELAKAVREGRRITLTILANAEKPDLNRVEQEFIRSEKANLNGPVRRLPN